MTNTSTAHDPSDPRHLRSTSDLRSPSDSSDPRCPGYVAGAGRQSDVAPGRNAIPVSRPKATSLGLHRIDAS